ncbi:MAG: hypothetical protein J5794_08060, partial [Lachnospiraceae bacterium]|nr:hypothetical protein [Lachnospiraceae bacterium]
MLYPKNRTKELSDDLFREPTAEYRGAPFWAWNDKLEPEELVRQIGELKEMGFGGFHMHPRDGMATPYLSEEHLSLIKLCNETAKLKEMLTWLYDEDRYPSGAAGGLVTKDRRMRETYLCFTREEDAADLPKTDPGDGSPFLVASFDVVLTEDGGLLEYPIASGTPKGTVWHVVCRTRDDSGWYNGQAYIDVMRPEAVKKFLEITYDRFAETVGEEFGQSIPAIFTDEPRMTRSQPISFSLSGSDRGGRAESQTSARTYDKEIAWSADFPETFRAAYHFDIAPHLPELIWQRADGAPSRARYLYHDHRSARFCTAYMKQLRDWCHAHGAALTGHFLGENTLDSQTASVGDLMRGYPYFDIPGMDLIMDLLLPNIAKQVQSVVHQCGKEAMLSELYGVTGWDFDFSHFKLQGDWQAAMGVSVRVPHLSWYSMRGDAKRDYPASIHYQSSWYREFKYLEDHYARVNAAMTRGKPLTEIAVVHPVESNWLEYAANDQTGDRRAELQSDFESIWKWLLYAPLDFDYLCESTLPELCGETAEPVLSVGRMTYKTVIIAGMETIRSTTVRLLLEFLHRGGRVLFVGPAPAYVDALVPEENDPLHTLLREAESVPFQKAALLSALEENRQISIRLEDGIDAGRRGEDWLYNYRQDGEDRWLFLASGVRMLGNGKKGTYPELDGKQVRITVKGRWKPALYDTLSGEIKPVSYELTPGDTVLHARLWCCDSLLLRLSPASSDD